MRWLTLIFIRAVLLIVVAGGATIVTAQVIPDIPYAGSLEAFVQSWDVDEGSISSKISQTYVPISVFMPVSDGYELKLSSAYVSMTRETGDDPSETVSGLSDVKIQANGSFLQRRLVLGLVANLPSGQGELTALEQDIVYDFVSPDLTVRANRLGEGFNVGGTASFANALSQTTTLALGAAVISRGGYDTGIPGSNSTISLSPGIESRATISLDVLSGTNHIKLGSMISIYGAEKVDDENNYKIGPELTFTADYSAGYAAGRGVASIGVIELLRLDNSIASGGSLVTEETSTNGNYLMVHGTNDYAVSSTVQVSVSAAGRLVGANGFDVGDSKVFEGGLAVTMIPNASVAVTVGGRYVSGSGTGFSGRDREIKGIEGMFRTIVRLNQ